MGLDFGRTAGVLTTTSTVVYKYTRRTANQIIGASQVVYVLGVSVEINQPTNQDHMIVNL